MRKHFRFADFGQPWRIRNFANKLNEMARNRNHYGAPFTYVIADGSTLDTCLRHSIDSWSIHEPQAQIPKQPWRPVEAENLASHLSQKLNKICAELKNDKQTNNVGVGGVVEEGKWGGRGSATRAARISAMVAFSLR